MSEIEQQRSRVSTDRKSGQQERLDAYLAKLDELKSRNSLREVIEREMLLEFLRLNQRFIDEYPLLETQQKTLVSIIFQPSATAHPGEEFIHKNADLFFAELNKYRHAEKNQDEKALSELSTSIYNREMVLIKCVQGMVYALYLVLDGFFESTVHYFGLPAVPVYEDFMNQYEAREKFWKIYFDEFFNKSIPVVYDSLADRKLIKISKTASYIILSISFDDVLSSLHSQDAPPELSRIQENYMRVGKTAEDLAYYRKILEILLRSDGEIMLGRISKEDLAFLSKVVCLDGGLRHSFEEPVSTGKEAAEAFLREQIFALALGGGMALQAMQDDFTSALNWMSSKESEGFALRLNELDVTSMYHLFFDLLQNYFIYFLTVCAGDELNKIQLRTTQQRRIPAARVADFVAKGLPVEAATQIFEKDASRAEVMLFKSNSAKALQAELESFNLPQGVSDFIIRYWNNAFCKVETHVIVDLAAVAKATTNLNKKLAEILHLYGVIRKSG